MKAFLDMATGGVGRAQLTNDNQLRDLTGLTPAMTASAPHHVTTAIDIHFHVVPCLFVDELRRGRFDEAVEIGSPGDVEGLVFHAPPCVVLEPGTRISPSQYDERLILRAMNERKLDAAEGEPKKRRPYKPRQPKAEPRISN